MSSQIEVRNLVIGDGIPKICVPIVAKNRIEIKVALKEMKNQDFDMVEWRADFFDEYNQPEKVEEMLGIIREELGEIPVLFTFRTRKEGGYRELTSIEEYIHMNNEVITGGLADLVDVETAMGDDVAFILIEAAHNSGVKVIASNHDFSGTPKKEEMLMRLCKMQELEADIVKLAVMPQCERDVLSLMDTTLTMLELHDVTPVVTMAMGEIGLLSRVSGSLFGSAITFGSIGEASAPGQIPAEKLRGVLKVLQRSNMPGAR